MLARRARVPVRTWRAPGRVNVVGDHTDYQDGWCLPMGIDRDCQVTLLPTGGEHIRARSAQMLGDAAVACDGSTETHTMTPPWGRFVAGAVAACVERGAHLAPYDIEVASTVPLGAGLSSSTALTVALVSALADVGGLDLARAELARLALDAEVRATGVPGGLLDQMAALHSVPGHVLLLDCRTLAVEPIPLPRTLGLVVVHAAGQRTLATSPYAQRRAEVEAVAARLGLATLRDAEPGQVGDDRRARHVVSENGRVLAAAEALRNGRADALGALMLESHASLRDDYEVSTPDLDRAVDLLMECGALGARLTGGGFGGCVVGLVQRNHADDILAKASRALTAAGERDVLMFAVRAGDAAGEVRPAGPRGV